MGHLASFVRTQGTLGSQTKDENELARFREKQWHTKLYACHPQRTQGFHTTLYDTGIFHSTTNAKEVTRQNPTLTGRAMLQRSSPTEFQYNIPSDVLPFTGWDYKAIKKVCYDKSLPNMYTLYISNILQKSFSKMTSDRVKFHFILYDFLKIESFLPGGLRYDHITTSNL